ncbi:MAG: hypothetical protein RLZZ383_2818 [Pseudomonadota bacterium]
MRVDRRFVLLCALAADGCASTGGDVAGTDAAEDVLDDSPSSPELGDSAVTEPEPVAWSVDGVFSVGQGDVALDVRTYDADGALRCASLGVSASVVTFDAVGDGTPAAVVLRGWPTLDCASSLPSQVRLTLVPLTSDLAPAADRWGVAEVPGLGVQAEVDGAWRSYGVLRSGPVVGQAPLRWPEGGYVFSAAYALPLAPLPEDTGAVLGVGR